MWGALLKKPQTALVLSVVLAVSLVQMPRVYSTEPTAPEKVLTFLKDVVKLDMTKYIATLVSNWVDYPPHWGGLAQEDVTYDLAWANETKLYVTCKLRDKTLYSCGLEVLKGSLIYAEPQPTNVLDRAKVLLERYQTYSGASYLQTMRNMLDTVTELKNITITLGNVKLTTSSQEVQSDPTVEAIKRTLFEWMYTVNGVDAPQNVVSFTFDQGLFKSFHDDWNLYKIGSTAVNVSKEEAINMAMNAAKNYTLKIWMNEWIEVKFNIVDEPVTAELFMYPRETLTVYPFWCIQLYFDKLYYSAYGIGVGIWADTKQIKYCESLSYGGGSPDGENSTAPPTEHPQDQLGFLGSNLPLEYGYATVTIVAVIIAAAAFLLYFRKIKKPNVKAEKIVHEAEM